MKKDWRKIRKNIFYVVVKESTGHYKVYTHNKAKGSYVEKAWGFTDENDAYAKAHELAKQSGLRLAFANEDVDGNFLGWE